MISSSNRRQSISYWSRAPCRISSTCNARAPHYTKSCSSCELTVTLIHLIAMWFG